VDALRKGCDTDPCRHRAKPRKNVFPPANTQTEKTPKPPQGICSGTTSGTMAGTLVFFVASPGNFIVFAAKEITFPSTSNQTPKVKQ
jgi:hypothetical protein